MRPSPRNPWVQVILTLVLTVGALAVLASAVDMDPPATASAGTHAAAGEGGAAPHEAQADPANLAGSFERLAPTKLGDLGCFQCHDREKYEHGERFPHATHRDEGAGHCHRCHAFQGHFEVVIRTATCEECH